MKTGKEVKATENPASFELPQTTILADAPLEIRLPKPEELFWLSGLAEQRRCLIFEGPSQIRSFFPVELPVSAELPVYLHEVVFHHAVSTSGNDFAVPEIRVRDLDVCRPYVPYLDYMFDDNPGVLMFAEPSTSRELTVTPIDLCEVPQTISRQEFASRLTQSLAPFVVDSFDHAWAKQLLGITFAVQCSPEVM